MANGVAAVGQHPHASLVGAVAGISVHVLLALGLALLPKVGLDNNRAAAVEVDLVTPPPPEPAPPPPPPPPPEPPVPPPDPTPKLAVRRPALHKAPPPMPNQETKPALTDTSPTPVFGVTEDSVVAGESPVAVPVGNTLMTNDRTLAKAAPAPLPAAPPPAASAFSPVDEESVAELPERVFVPEPPYPEMARRLGIEGRVRLRLGVDRKGNVKSVRVIQKVGYGMDEAAEAAAWKSKWRPAKKDSGEAVDVIIHYDFSFHLPMR